MTEGRKRKTRLQLYMEKQIQSNRRKRKGRAGKRRDWNERKEDRKVRDW